MMSKRDCELLRNHCDREPNEDLEEEEEEEQEREGIMFWEDCVTEGVWDSVEFLRCLVMFLLRESFSYTLFTSGNLSDRKIRTLNVNIDVTKFSSLSMYRALKSFALSYHQLAINSTHH